MKTKILFLLVLVLGVSIPSFSGTYTITQNDVISLTSGYVNNMEEVWNVQSTVTDKPLKITYLIGTESSWDFVTINSVNNQGVATTLLTLSGTKSGVISTLIPNGKAQIRFESDGSVSNYNDPEEPRDPEDPNPYFGLNISFAVDNDNIIQNNLHVSGNTQTDGDLHVSGFTQTDGNLYVNGKIGLGTITPPTKKFEILEGVGGRFSFSAANCTSGYEVSQTVDNTGYKLNVGSSIRDYRLSVNGTDRLIISSAGNVGIGTTTPTSVFTISKTPDANKAHLSFGNPTATSGQASSLMCFTGNGIQHAGLSWVPSSLENQGKLHLSFGGNANPISNPIKVTFQNDGNVGIGITSPSEKLTIAGGHSDTKMRLYSTGNGSDQPSNLSLWASEPYWTYYGAGIGYNVNGSPHYGRIDNSRGSSFIRFLPGETKFMFQTTSATDVDALTINENGKVGIGTSVIPSDYKLAVAGKIIAEEVVVKLQSNWPDYVFKPNYNLMPLHQVEQFVTANNHLPGIPSAAEVQNDGISMGEMQNKLLQKIEELTLYIIEQQKQIDELKKQVVK
ncbi:MAG: hypothetical protein VB102_10205 [Paludibacter sp.]|nr:hypothetical protein [Paludibacter sp.]